MEDEAQKSPGEVGTLCRILDAKYCWLNEGILGTFELLSDSSEVEKVVLDLCPAAAFSC